MEKSGWSGLIMQKEGIGLGVEIYAFASTVAACRSSS